MVQTAKFILTSCTISLLLVMLATRSVNGLDCYVCRNQEDNKGKCVSTVKTCDIGQDQCLTEIRWGGMPYYHSTGEKQYYVSKRCASRENCTSERERVARRCERIWFNDWECVDCCNGDRCNFFVTLSSADLSPTVFLTFLLPFLIPHILRQR